jgi:ABC-type antimicrobial peptide transport system permease subunit
MGIGAVAGLLVAWVIGGTLEGLLFGVSTTDAFTSVGVVVLVALLGLVTTLIPSWRATKIDPVAMLRRG